jgi:hypothetical protein
MTQKEKVPKVWHGQHEKVLKDWGESSSCYRYMHNKAYQVYKTRSMGFTLPIIIISTITGTANFAQQTFPAAWASYVPSVIGAFNLIAAIMTTIAQFLKVTELMESHRVTSIHYGKLARKIKLELTLPVQERTQNGDAMIDVCRAEYDRLIEQSPPVPKSILLLFDKRFPDAANTFSTPELTTISPISLFDHEAEEERLRKKYEKMKEDASIKLKQMIPSYHPAKQEVIQELQNLKSRSLVSRRDEVPSHPASLVAEEEEEVEVVIDLP